MLGALGKLFATSITYPYITVKSRMHVAGRDGGKQNMVDAIRKIIREEGYVGLYKGMLHS
jgi:adenine nucleotide transporter 17